MMKGFSIYALILIANQKTQQIFHYQINVLVVVTSNVMKLESKKESKKSYKQEEKLRRIAREKWIAEIIFLLLLRSFRNDN